MHPAEKRYGPKPTPDEEHRAIASDGWQLALRRYTPRGANPHGEPVLLQHGLGTCSKQFDLGMAGSPSLAQWLADRGYDVWSADLRGSGSSQRSSPGAKANWDWCVDDFVHEDGPAFMSYILAQTGFKNLHWVGHSLGGILMLCHAAVYGSARIASGTSAAAGLDYTGSGSSYDMIEPLKGIGRLVKRIPAGFWSKTISPFFGRINNPLEASFFYPPNMDPDAARAIAAGAQYDISGEVLFQLASLFKSGGLLSRDGSVRYADLAHRIETPVMLLAGEKDLQCSPAVVEKTHLLLDNPKHQRRNFGKSHGHVEHYGHFDLFAGRNADKEVFPHVHDWLLANPAQRRHDERAPILRAV
jgi:pimeloyl-ACP methyl ester carboxylesterase